jgi:hypothetical protein
VKSADTADLKSADLNRSWGFKSPSGHQKKSIMGSDVTATPPVDRTEYAEGVFFVPARKQQELKWRAKRQ